MADILIAYCWATGLIQFGSTTPDGAVSICHGPDADVRRFIDATSRKHGYSHGEAVLLVPGVPEATSQNLAMDALLLHRAWLKKRVPLSITMGYPLWSRPMSVNDLKVPKTLADLKRLAKAIRRAHEIQHAAALDVAAKQAGFADFRSAREALPAA